MLTQKARETVDQDWSELVKEQTQASFKSLSRNMRIDLGVRVGLYLMAGLILVRLVFYVFDQANPMASELLDAREGNDARHWWETLGAVAWPVVLLIVIAALCVGLGLHIRSRSDRYFEAGQEGVSRLRRDSVGVPRARALTQVLEEHVDNARRAFRLQLWLSRALFAVGVALLIVLVTYALVTGDVDGVTVLFGIGIVADVIVIGVFRPGEKIGVHLADVTQLQLASITSMRQISLLEEHAYKVIGTDGDPQAADRIIKAAVKEMAEISHNALTTIQRYAEPRALHSNGSTPKGAKAGR